MFRLISVDNKVEQVSGSSALRSKLFMVNLPKHEGGGGRTPYSATL